MKVPIYGFNKKIILRLKVENVFFSLSFFFFLKFNYKKGDFSLLNTSIFWLIQFLQPDGQMNWVQWLDHIEMMSWNLIMFIIILGESIYLMMDLFLFFAFFLILSDSSQLYLSIWCRRSARFDFSKISKRKRFHGVD